MFGVVTSLNAAWLSLQNANIGQLTCLTRLGRSPSCTFRRQAKLGRRAHCGGVVTPRKSGLSSVIVVEVRRPHPGEDGAITRIVCQRHTEPPGAGPPPPQIHLPIFSQYHKPASRSSRHGAVAHAPLDAYSGDSGEVDAVREDHPLHLAGLQQGGALAAHAAVNLGRAELHTR